MITFGKKKPTEGLADEIASVAGAVPPNALGATFAPGKNAGFMKELFAQLYNSKAAKQAMANRAKTLGMSADQMANAQQSFFEQPLNVQAVDIADGTKGSALGNTMRLLGANIKAHPLQAAGTGLGIASNVAGLVDNDNFLGQGLGIAAGAVLPKLAGLGLSPYATLNTALAGGAIGSLFDTLTDKKEKERMAQMPASYTTY